MDDLHFTLFDPHTRHRKRAAVDSRVGITNATIGDWANGQSRIANCGSAGGVRVTGLLDE